jgi:hypothetical protein
MEDGPAQNLNQELLIEVNQSFDCGTQSVPALPLDDRIDFNLARS